MGSWNILRGLGEKRRTANESNNRNPDDGHAYLKAAVQVITVIVERVGKGMNFGVDGSHNGCGRGLAGGVDTVGDGCLVDTCEVDRDGSRRRKARSVRQIESEVTGAIAIDGGTCDGSANGAESHEDRREDG